MTTNVNDIQTTELDLRGEYTVELFEKGRKVEEIKRHNYITPLWAINAKAMQVHPLLAYGFPYNNGANLWLTKTETLDVMGQNRRINQYSARALPQNAVILTDWDAAENTAEHWLKGHVIAWASLWKSSVIPAAGRRGQINEAECTMVGDPNIFKWVWDWSTQQGNGTYQTLALGAIAGNPPYDAVNLTRGPNFVTCGELAANPMGYNAGFVYRIGVYHNPITKKWLTLYGSNGAPNLVTATDAGTVMASSDFDGTGQGHNWDDLTWSTVTQLAASGIAITTSGTSTTAFGAGGQNMSCYPCADGSIIFAYPCKSAGYARVGKMNSGGTNIYNIAFGAASGSSYLTWSHPNTVHYGIVEVGSFYYVGVGYDGPTLEPAAANADTKKIIRIDPATGAFSANIALPADHYLFGALTTDGTYLYVPTNKGILKMQTDGTVLMNLGSHYNWPGTEQGLAPWQTSATSQWLYPFNGYSRPINPLGEMQDPSQTVSLDASFPQYMGYATSSSYWTGTHYGLKFFNDRLWMDWSNYGGPYTPPFMWLGLTGANMLSRSRLDSPVTKTASQTMKVSYELTLPSPLANWHDHPVVV